jgi:hypothetical protein
LWELVPVHLVRGPRHERGLVGLAAVEPDDPYCSAVRHATAAALDELEPLLVRLRALPRLVEKKRGVFYRGGRAFLHFHEDPSGLHADVRLDSAFERVRVQTAQERDALLERIRRA